MFGGQHELDLFVCKYASMYQPNFLYSSLQKSFSSTHCNQGNGKVQMARNESSEI
jgi:hypothetical protein